MQGKLENCEFGVGMCEFKEKSVGTRLFVLNLRALGISEDLREVGICGHYVLMR